MRKRWYKIDNCGKFYALTKKTNPSAVFRYSTTLKDEIDENILQEALEKTVLYFPNFNCRLKKGFFWYYLETDYGIPKVTKETQNICANIYKDSDSILFRVSYYKKRINFEVSHILSDGRGSILFMKYLVGSYIIKYYKLNDYEININYDSTDLERAEDGFDKHYAPVKKSLPNGYKIYHYRGKKSKNIKYFEYHLPVDEVLKVTHLYNVSLTSLLLAILIKAFQSKMKDSEKANIIKISVPVDLRPYYNSYTSKNFFGLITIIYKKEKDESLEKVANEVQKQLKEKSKINNLKVRVNYMVRLEKNLLIRTIPIFLKDLIFKLVDIKQRNTQTANLSNIGVITMDDKLNKYIDNFNVLNSTNGFKLTICSFKNDLSIGISNKYEDNDLIKYIVDIFKEYGISGTINTNLEDEDEM